MADPRSPFACRSEAPGRAPLEHAWGILAAALFLALVSTPIALAQAAGPPWVSLDYRVWPSPHAQVAQTIGVSEISLSYSRPAAKGRVIWGELVPYGQVWRAGADWNTTLTVGDPVTIEGQPLAAGTYGLHILPEDGRFTLILSRFSGSWGSFGYRPEEDVLKIEVKTLEAPHRERLTYGFRDLSETAATLFLHWGKLEMPVRVVVDTHGLALARFRDGFRSLSGFTWMGHANAARYCLDNEIALEEGLGWIEKALEEQKSYDTLALKALILDQLERSEEAEVFYHRAVELASPRQMGFLGSRLTASDRAGRAVELLAMGVEQHPESWRMRVHLARALNAAGDPGAARQAFFAARELAPENRRAAVTRMLDDLGEQSGP